MKLLCDQMLGSLAKWLRIYGFDTFYANASITDDMLLQIAKEEHRVLLTRDKELIWRGKRENISVISISDTDLDNQLRQILSKLPFDEHLLLTRCLLCNSPLRKVQKEEVKDCVPQKVFENNDMFWFCDHCKKYYWKGTHVENMVEKIRRLQQNNT
jgi:hypothetical protein